MTKDSLMYAEAVNLLHAHIPKIWESITSQLKQYAEKKIFKVGTCQPTERTPITQARINKVQGGNNISIYSYFKTNVTGSNRLYLVIEVCYSDGKYEDKTYFCHYYHVQPYIGEMEDGRLIIPEEGFNCPVYPVHDLKEMEDKAKEIKKAIEELNQLIKVFPYELRPSYGIPNELYLR